MHLIISIIRNIMASLLGFTKKHYITYYFCNLLGIVHVFIGFLYPYALHSFLFAAMYFIIGRVLLNADIDTSDPLNTKP